MQNNYQYEYILFFNSNYFDTRHIFQIIYPLSVGKLFMDEKNDILYGSKNTMLMLYNNLNSESFKKMFDETKSYLKKKYLFDYIKKNYTILT